MKRILILLAIMGFTSQISVAQSPQNSGWLMLLNSTKLNDKFGLHFDAQFRTANDWAYLRNVLIRPGVTYYINKNANATLGYLYTTTNNDNLAGLNKNLLTEHRVWQQYIYNQQPWKGAALSHRFRLEQRFIETQNEDLFAQRLRYFVRLLQPLQKQEGGFTKGPFLALQNELFFNIQNKDELNGSLFDQNRAYLAAGYRFSKKMDIEVGYLNQAIKGAKNNIVNNAVQLALYTRF